MSNAQHARRNNIRPYIPDGKVDPVTLSTAGLDELTQRLHEATPEEQQAARHNLLWKLMSTYIPAEKESVQVSFVNHAEYTLARSRFTIDQFSSYLAASYSVRDRLIELFNDTEEYMISNKVKQCYYVSIEFLVGRFLRNALLNLELEDLYKDSLAELGIGLDQIYNEEYDPGLGNGGLGRLAACFMDSLATLNLPAWGYGLMYSFGMFKQTIGADGSQVEIPDYWLNYGDPWRVEKPTITHQIHFYGRVEHGVWKPGITIMAVANDFLIPGFATDNTIGLRLWNSRPTSDLDDDKFRSGDYYDAISLKQRCENLTSVLYPNDSSDEGKEMRLMQEYFLSSATLKDIIRRLKTQQKCTIEDLPKLAAIQLNDTHPAIMVAELIRILVDEEDVPFHKAVEISRAVFSYTCHTLMPEALEKWSVPLFQNLLPRHLELIYELNHHFLNSVRGRITDQDLATVSIIEESNPKMVRMANLAVIGSHMVNGVAEIHSDLMKKHVFNAFYRIWPEKFINKTNGVTIRRWLHHCNPQLSRLITSHLGSEDWTLKAEELTKLVERLDDEKFINEWAAIKLANKFRLAEYVEKTLGVKLDPVHQMFDVQVKRIHEYKRQTLNVMSVIDRYLHILDATPSQRAKMTPRAIIFGGKAAPGYYAAKKLIKLINNVSKVINNDPNVGDLLKLVYIPNYNVSIAEVIIPATDLSQHISTAGLEASGTSNMKFAFNAGLIIGTHDGATIEIAEAIGQENVFFFGAKADKVDQIRSLGKRPLPERLARVFNTIRSGTFGEPGEYESVLGPIENGDHYLCANDFPDYLECQERVDAAYRDQHTWIRKCIISTAHMGRFSSDRTISEYAKEVWNVEPCPLPRIAEAQEQQTVGAPVPAPISGSIGSLRRHHLTQGATFTSHQDNVSFAKGGFGSLTRRSDIGRQSHMAPVKEESDSDDGLEINY